MAGTIPMPGDPEIQYSSDLTLGEGAVELVHFDIESVSQVLRSQHEGAPDAWLARPEGYQSEGHVLRDSEKIRLIAYCRSSSVIYATDGCNACRHHLDQPLEEMSDDALQSFASDTQLPYAMLSRLSKKTGTD